MAFVNNTELQEALLMSHAVGHVTAECYRMFEDISEQRIKLMLKYNFKTHHDLMKIKCVDKCLKVWQNYRFDRDNAFAYFVTIIDNTIKLYFMQNNVQFVSIDEQEQVFNND